MKSPSADPLVPALPRAGLIFVFFDITLPSLKKLTSANADLWLNYKDIC